MPAVAWRVFHAFQSSLSPLSPTPLSLQVGDVIAEADGRNVRHVTLQELTHMLKGPAGSEVEQHVPCRSCLSPPYPHSLTQPSDLDGPGPCGEVKESWTRVYEMYKGALARQSRTLQGSTACSMRLDPGAGPPEGGLLLNIHRASNGSSSAHWLQLPTAKGVRMHAEATRIDTRGSSLPIRQNHCCVHSGSSLHATGLAAAVAALSDSTPSESDWSLAGPRSDFASKAAPDTIDGINGYGPGRQSPSAGAVERQRVRVVLRKEAKMLAPARY